MIQKADYYADKIVAAGTEDECVHVIAFVVGDLLNEAVELAKTRHTKMDSGFFGILHEIDQKWHRIVRLCSKKGVILKHEGFQIVLEDLSPNVAYAWEAYKRRLVNIRNRSN